MGELTTAEAPQRLDGTRDEFVGDLRTAIGAWRAAPWLPIVGTLLMSGGGVATFWPGAGGGGDGPPLTMGAGAALLIGLGAMAIAVYNLGWAGSERVAYRRLWKGRRVTLGDTLTGAFEYVGRFLVLGLLCYLPVMVVVAVALLAMDIEPARATPVIWLLAVGILIALTFVAPALAYDEDRATAALRVGLRMLRAQGRRAAWYALVPAATTVVSAALSWLGGPVAVVSAIVFALAHVALRGATAAAYLRLTTPAPPLHPGVVAIEPL